MPCRCENVAPVPGQRTEYVCLECGAAWRHTRRGRWHRHCCELLATHNDTEVSATVRVTVQDFWRKVGVVPAERIVWSCTACWAHYQEHRAGRKDPPPKTILRKAQPARRSGGVHGPSDGPDTGWPSNLDRDDPLLDLGRKF